jgi:hypothetical protein
MGTRSTIKFYKDGVFLCAIYQQYDGYLEGVGKELKHYIKSKPFVNGIGNNRNVFNGAGCFVAQFISNFKVEAGYLYITTEDNEQEFNYKVNLINSGEGWESKISMIDLKCVNKPYDDVEKELIEKFNEIIVLNKGDK